MTGGSGATAMHVAREFGENAECTRGQSVVIFRSGINHWLHADMGYRTVLNLTALCGCQGVNGGGWAHYTCEKRVLAIADWATMVFALDWLRPPGRQK